MIKIGITGHRPERIKNRKGQIQKWLIQTFKKLQEQDKEVVLINGMAQGVDQIAALAAIKCGVQVYCYFPYRHKLHPIQDYIATHAEEIRYECDEYQRNCYFKRDRRIVDDCDILLVIWDGKKVGGTWYTYSYAEEQGKNILLFPWNIKENQGDDNFGQE